MADALVSSLVTTILNNLNDVILGESAILGGSRTELQNLESTFTTIQAVLHDAEVKQWKSESVKNWLTKLKDLAYDADDILDEFSIHAQRWTLRGFRYRVRSFFSVDNPLVFYPKMAYKLKNISEKLDAIASERHKFHLTEGTGDVEVDNFDWRQTSSFLNEPEIYGRKKEKEEIINMLRTNGDDFSVYAICGMGGLGKTTLAQLVYNDGRVETHFHLRIWVCVSDDFDIRRLTRAIIESIEGSPCNNQELDPLQRRLQENLTGKKFLLVLDDVWNENLDKWNGLSSALRCGARGSIVIVTTRTEKIAVMMATTAVQHMVRLSDDDSWLLFERLAFGARPREEYAHLETIGKDIVKKCGGVPLAVKALGSLMRFRRTGSEWLSIKQSNTWDLPDEGKRILPALKLSYDHLPPHLRQCLSFCSVFPKDYPMPKDMLIQLWMANGFISSIGQMDLHDRGNEVFRELILRSFFEDIGEDFYGNITCKIHDLVHDLAESVMNSECCIIEPNKTLKFSKWIRHLAICSYDYMIPIPKYKDLHKVKDLRSFLGFSGTDWYSILPHLTALKHLRALHLDTFKFNKLPISIGKLKHLRYLCISSSDIKILPESISSLQKLQTLNIKHCYSLVALPQGMRQMKDLIFLDIEVGNSLWYMPAGIGQLTCLRKLSTFIVGKEAGLQIGELKELNLAYKLTIKGLDNVKSLADARSANMISKKDLKSLELIWKVSDSNTSTEKIEEILLGLQPHSNLKELIIDRYQGSKFPNWFTDLQLPNLVKISLKGCNRLEHLPPFGKLKFLKYLELYGAGNVKCLGSEVHGDGESSFPSLEWLTLFCMDSLEEWAFIEGRNAFPQLGKLVVRYCPKLVELPIIPSVRTLEIQGGSEMLLKSVQSFTFITSLRIQDFHEVTHLPDGMLQNHTLLEHLELSSMRSLESMSSQLDNLFALRSLTLEVCDKLDILPESLYNLSSLETLDIFRCGIEFFPINQFCGLSLLLKLKISWCDKFTNLSEGMRYLTALEDLYVGRCSELTSLPESIGHLTSLRILCISYCDGLSSLPNQIGHLTLLNYLAIHYCSNLMCLPEGVQSLQKLREVSIIECPHLKRRCMKERGEDWPKIAHVPLIRINDQLIQGSPS